MAHQWLAYIDNIASFRNGTLLFDIERHVARRISTSGKITHTLPRYAFMIDHVGAVERKLIFKRPLSADTFIAALHAHPGYLMEKKTPVSIRYGNPEKNVFCSWEDCVSFGQDRAGTMIGLIQKRPTENLKEMLEKTIPAALADWNELAKKLNLAPIDRPLYHKLVREARKADKNFPKHKKTVRWPKNPIRFLFEQE